MFLLLALTIGFMLLQNLVGLIGAMVFGLPAPVAVLLGSASLIGGHGTAIAWGPQIEEVTGFAASAEIGIATATLGLVLAALIGGPIAKYLIDRFDLHGRPDADPIVGLEFQPADAGDDTINQVTLMRGMLAVHLAILIGYFAHGAILEMGLKLPLFVPCLLTGIVMSNTIPYLLPKLIWPARTPALAVISDYTLSGFLAMSLMRDNKTITEMLLDKGANPYLPHPTRRAPPLSL